MNRTGLFIALAVAVAGGLVFGLFPDLDLAASRFFTDKTSGSFAPPVHILDRIRDFAWWVIVLCIAPVAIALLVKIAMPRRRMLIAPSTAIFLVATLALGPGLTTNVILKDYWGRTRPHSVKPFGGEGKFVPWWDTTGGCYDNCSFVAGEPSGAFWTLAPASLAPPAWRPLAYSAAILFALGLGIVRMIAGAHFFSDVMFAGVFTFLIVWLAHFIIYRWPRTRLDDGKIEHAIERAALLCTGRTNEIAGPKAGDQSMSGKSGR